MTFADKASHAIAAPAKPADGRISLPLFFFVRLPLFLRKRQKGSPIGNDQNRGAARGLDADAVMRREAAKGQLQHRLAGAAGEAQAPLRRLQRASC